MKQISKSSCQLVAHCLFAKGEISYNNYDKYYKDQEYQHILDQIEMEADY